MKVGGWENVEKGVPVQSSSLLKVACAQKLPSCRGVRGIGAGSQEESRQDKLRQGKLRGVGGEEDIARFTLTSGFIPTDELLFLLAGNILHSGDGVEAD